jgi:divalent metal cation (Fe/Co/Zn/Cd) transporter
MNKRRELIVPAVIVGILLLALAVLYFVDSAAALPSFIPGHEAGSGHHHVKHGIAAAILAIGAFVVAWFQSGPARQ